MVLGWSEAARRLLGFDEGAIVGRSFAPCHPGGLEGLRVDLDGAGAGSLHSEGWLVGRGGSKVWTSRSLSAVRDGRGQVVSYALVARRAVVPCVRERLFEQVRGDRQRLASLIEHMPVGVVLVDPRGQLLCNRRARDIWGCTPFLDAPQQPGEVLLGADHQPLPAHATPVARLLDGEEFSALELVAETAQGVHVHVRCSGAPLRGDDGALEGGVILLENVTAAKHSEQLRSEWPAVVAHDLMQPLSVIQMHASIMRRHPERVCDKSLAHILHCVKRLDRMVQDLGDSSLLQARRLSLAVERVDLGELLHRMVDRVDHDIGGKRVVLDAPASLPTLQADPHRVEQVFWNLLSNAAKYSDPDTTVALQVRVHDEALEVRVSNRGPGMEPGALARLFQRYERLHSDRMPRVRGLGLGLYIARGIVEAHGGRIWAESEPGGLTTFHVLLPLAK